MSTPTATPSPSRLWLYFQETHGMALTASEESDIRHAANAAAESDIRTLETELARLRADLARFTGDGLLDCHAICDQRDTSVAERDRLRAEVERLKKQIKDDNRSYGCELRDPYGTIWEQAAKDHARAKKAEAECLEQARLLGKSGEREADLLGKIDRLNRVIERASVQFFHEGTDGETAAKMLNVLNETK